MTGPRRVRTAGDVARGLAALLLLAALLAGIPTLLLIVVGVPLALPGAAQLRGYLTRPDDGTVFIAAAASIAWAGWAVFALSTAIEAAAAVRGRRRELPGLTGVQRPAAHLVSAVAVLLAGTATPTLGGAPPRPVAAAPHTPPVPASATDPETETGPAVQARVTPPAVATGREIVVRPRDTLWSLAERHHGDPLGWRALAEANYGRPQPDGRHLTDAHWVYPGWRLRLPDGWPPAAHPRPTDAGRAEQSRHPPRLVPHPPPRDAEAAAPAPPPVSAAPSVDPRPGRGGQPPVPAPAPARPDPTVPDLPVSATPAAGGSGEAARVAGLTGSGLLAAGLLLELRRRRRRQQRQRRAGERIPLPEPGTAATESQLHRAADPAAANALRLVLRHLAESAPVAAASVRAAELGPSRLRLWLSGEQQPPPAPWQAGSDPGTWVLDAAGRRDLLTGALPMMAPDPLPGLLTVGRAEDGSYLLWNLEAAVVTTVSGPPARTDSWLRTAALELATSPWSGGGWFELAVVGVDVPELDRVARYPSLVAALDDLERRAAETRDALTESPLNMPPDMARVARPDDERLAPTLLVTAETPDDGQLTRLHAATGIGTLALIAAPAATAAMLALDGTGIATVTPLGLSVTARALTAEEVDAVSALFATAAAPPVPAGAGRYAELTDGDLLAERHLVPTGARPAPGRSADPDSTAAPGRPRRLEAVTPPVPESDPRAAGDVDDPDGQPAAEPQPETAGLGGDATAMDGVASSPSVPRDGGIELCILGPVTVRGAAAPVTRRALELAVMLALAGPAGITPDRLDTYLGTDSDTPNVRSNRRHEIVSRTRRALGPAAGGAPAVLRDGAVYRLHPSVTLDYSRLVALTDRGGREDLRAALALVRGVPLDGVDLWWFPNHGLSVSNEALSRIIDAAETLAFLEYDDGNPAAAEAAIRAGLRAGPDERLYQALMIVRGSDPAAVERAWRECTAALSAHEDSPGEETLATYRRILAAQRRASA